MAALRASMGQSGSLPDLSAQVDCTVSVLPQSADSCRGVEHNLGAIDAKHEPMCVCVGKCGTGCDMDAPVEGMVAAVADVDRNATCTVYDANTTWKQQ